MSITLMPFQAEGVARIHELDGVALLADEQGLGKTIQALHFVSTFPGALPGLVVCPASLKLNWQAEALRFGIRADVGVGRKPPGFGGLLRANGHSLLILNYDILDGWKDYIKACKFKTILIDEAQYVKNRDTKRTRILRAIAKPIPHRVGMSGTPLTNRPGELWSILNILWPLDYPTFGAFGNEFCAPRMTPWGLDYRGSRNLPKLHKQLKEHGMIRRLKADVLKDLPPKVRAVVRVPIEHPGQYRTALLEFSRWVQANYGPAKAAAAKRSESFTKLGYLRRLAAKLKMAAVYEWIDNFLESTNEKLVVFAIQTEIVAALQARYKNSVIVNGAVTGANRELAVRRFMKDPATRVFIGNIEAAGVGLTLTAASTVVFVEMELSPGKMEQAADRVHRITQESQVTIYYLVASGTIEERICQMLQEKQQILNSVLDGTSLSADGMEIFDMLMREMESPMFAGSAT